MIVKMKKATILVKENERDSALKKLRKLGVLHINDIVPPVSEDISLLESKLDESIKAMEIIEADSEKSVKVDQNQIENEIENILSQHQQKEILQRELEENLETSRWFERWGDVSFASVEQLKSADVFVRYYTCDKSALQRIPRDNITVIAAEKSNTVYLALISTSPDYQLDLKEDPMPQIEFSEIKVQIQKLEKEIQTLNSRIKKLAAIRPSLIDYQLALQKKIELIRIKFGMGIEGQLAYLQGFCPRETVNEVENLCDKEGWGYIVDEPDDPNEVPTLLRNPKWVRMIKPLFDFMGTIPGYAEQDVSLVFLAFFSIFYAIIVGDAGYGLVFLTATLFFDLKKKGGPRDFFNLMYLVSISTIGWGVITGTWFGAEQIAQLPFLKIFIIEEINSFNPHSSELIMQLTFVIGAVHLTIGHLMNAFKKINSLIAIADVGWIFVLWSVFFIANNIVLGKEMSALTKPLLIGGVVLILLFANFQKNVIKGILTTLGNLPLDIISSFSDIVSYIRLFAVGLATVIVATNFNTMALGSGINSIVSGIIAALVLLLGHSINLALCGMSILVHGVRLNMLEFSGHVGVQWTGKAYQPFKE